MGCRHIRELYQAPIETEVTFKPSFLLVSSGNSIHGINLEKKWNRCGERFRPREKLPMTDFDQATRDTGVARRVPGWVVRVLCLRM